MVSILVLALAVTLMIPLEAGAQSRETAVQQMTETEVKGFLDQYIDRFKAKDLNGFMALFSREAVENRMLPYLDMQESYKNMFELTNQFLYHLNVQDIKTYTRKAYASGRYEVIQTLKDQNKMKVHKGNIQFELVRENDGLKILRLNYGRDL